MTQLESEHIAVQFPRKYFASYIARSHWFWRIYVYFYKFLYTCTFLCVHLYDATKRHWRYWWDTFAVCATRSVINEIAWDSNIPMTRPDAVSNPVRLNLIRIRFVIKNRVELQSDRVPVARLQSKDRIYGISGDKLRQKHMHTSNYGHNGVPSVSRYAATLHK